MGSGRLEPTSGLIFRIMLLSFRAGITVKIIQHHADHCFPRRGIWGPKDDD